jgi:predicted transglutaminase-like cysteine proteinase
MRHKSTSIAIYVSAFMASYSLFYVTGDRVTYSRGIDAPLGLNTFDTAASTPLEFLSVSERFNAEMDHINAAMSAAKSAASQNLSVDMPVAETPRADQNASVAALEPAATPSTHVDPLPARSVAPRTAEHQASLEVTQNYTHGLDANVDRVSFDTPTLPPMAFMRFCARYADDCKVQDTSSDVVSLTDARRAELVRINREVNRAITPQANLGGVMAEEWLINPPEGDCNDYAVTKRHELLAAGWPSRALLLAEVVVPSGEHHLVLVVRGQEDDLVLDSLNWNIRSVGQIRYQWVRVQQANNPKFRSVASVNRAAHMAMDTRQGHRS